MSEAERAASRPPAVAEGFSWWAAAEERAHAEICLRAYIRAFLSVFVYVCISHTDACMYVCVFVRVVTCMLMFVCSNIYVRKIQIIIQNKYKHTKKTDRQSVYPFPRLIHMYSHLITPKNQKKMIKDIHHSPLQPRRPVHLPCTKNSADKR